MPVEAQTVEYSYLGDGVSTIFEFPSRFLSNDDIRVGVNGVEQHSGFTVSGAGEPSGGEVVFSSPPPNAARITLLRAPALSQLIDFVNGQTVLEGTLDNALDKLTIITQYLSYVTKRSVRLSDFDSLNGSGLVLPAPYARAGRFFAFDDAGRPIMLLGQPYAVDVAREIQADTFDKQADLYQEDEGDAAARAAIAFRSRSTGQHDKARIAFYVKQVAEGSGLEAGPQQADFATAFSVFKDGFPSLDANPGEIDTVQLSFRQVNGDAAGILVNGVIINGFGAGQEGNIYSIDPVTFLFKHGFNYQDAVVNDRDGEYYGIVRIKSHGDGGKGLFINTAPAASLDLLFEFASKNKTQFSLRPSDATLILYAFNNPADHTLIDQFDGGMRLRDPDGTVYNDLKSRPVEYTTTVGVDSGTISATVQRCYYVRRGKQYEIFFDLIVNGTTGSPSRILLDIPPGLVPIAGGYFGGHGVNAGNLKGLTSVWPGGSGGRFAISEAGSGGFPAAPGHRLAGSITIMTD